jgi:hypothetical protein
MTVSRSYSHSGWALARYFSGKARAGEDGDLLYQAWTTYSIVSLAKQEKLL